MDLKASKDTDIAKLAGKIAYNTRNNEPTNVISIGIESTYVAIKSIIYARTMLAENGENLIVIPGQVEIPNTNDNSLIVKAIKFRLECV